MLSQAAGLLRFSYQPGRRSSLGGIMLAQPGQKFLIISYDCPPFCLFCSIPQDNVTILFLVP